MAQFTTPPVIDGFETTLAQAWNWLVGTIYVNAIPDATLSGWDKTYVVVNPWKTTQQVARISWWTSGQLTCDSITVKKWAGTNYSSTTHAVKSKVIITDTYQTWEDIKTAVNSKASTDSSNTRTAEQTFNWEWYPPEYTTSQRDAITWNRDGAIISNTTTGTNQQRTGWAWVDIGDTGTSNASDTNAGKVEMATLSQVDNGDSIWETGARLAVWPAELVNIKSVWALIDSTFLAWENVTANDSLFAETWPTFAQATSVANIWDVTANTRYEFPIIGDGVAKTTLKLWLKKFVSPSVDLKLRFENDSAWSPSGTLFSWTTETTISTAWLTTSIVDTTVTLAQSTTIPLWTVVRIVLYAGVYWSETINATNYFGIAYSTNDTTTRWRKLRNGTVHSATNTTIWTYISGIGLNTLLSKTDADFAYKLPTDGISRFAKSTALAWVSIPCYNKGIVWGFTSLTNNTLYYLWNTPWSIGTSIWTNVFLVGTSMSPTSIYIYDWLRRFFHSTITSSFWAGTTYNLNNKYVKQLVLKYLWTGSVTHWKYFVLTAGDNTFTYKDWGSSPEWTVTRNVNANTVTFINNWYTITPLDMYVEI